MNYSPLFTTNCTRNSSTYTEGDQLGIFTEPNPDLIVDRVPERLALAVDRYYIRHSDWSAGIQLTRDEAYRAIGLIGRKRDPEAIYSAIERVVDGGVL
ncbi:MAG: hypothetical protein KME13_11355 [Myxacorys californica WJT36-NPBG1]|jgi:hypothetical protein|nr:hypothetical protein [Myxacorys californica WJT36-NPBG1]